MADQRVNKAWLERSDQGVHQLGGNCSIGRSAVNHIVLSSETVSRRHTAINEAADNEYWVVDLGSSNGTYVNGRRVSRPVLLRNADKIMVGDVPFVFHQQRAIGVTDPRNSETVSNMTVQEIRSSDYWILLADIESSTTLSDRYSPNELPRVIGRWLDRCRRIIDANDGMINKFLGDGFLAYWRHHDGVENQIANCAKELKTLQSKKDPAFRVVLHFGQVITGGSATMGEESLSGPAVNFAFRMEKKAPEIGVSRIMSESVRDKLRHTLAGTNVGSHGLFGFTGKYPFFEF